MGKTKLHPGAKWLFRLSAYLVALILSIFAVSFGSSLLGFFISSIISILFIGIVLVIVLTIVLGEIYSQMTYNRWFYEFTKHGLKLERGIIWKRYSNIPYDRIQNIDIHRGILARIFGFSTLDIQTAGYSGGYGRNRRRSEGHIPAVSIKDAEKIRESVMKKISKRHSRGL